MCRVIDMRTPAATALAHAADTHGWTLETERYAGPATAHLRTWTRGNAIVRVGLSPRGNALETAGLTPDKTIGTGYIDDPIPTTWVRGRDDDAVEQVLAFLAAEAEATIDVVVIPCAAAKRSAPSAASELYTSPNFALMLRAARAHAEATGARVLILSALHGLLDLDAIVAPYDVKMGDPDSITRDALAAQVAARRLGSVTTLLPSAYARALDAAVEQAGGPDLIDLFADAPGIGFQRGVASALLAVAA